MPTNKLASFRYRVIDKCLSNKYKKYTLDELLKTLSNELYEQFGIDKGVSRRTFFNDINVMRSPYPRGFNAPIICKNGYYQYEDPDFSITKSPFNEADLANLHEAFLLLQQFKGLPLLESLSSIIAKLKSEMAYYNLPTHQIILFDTNHDYTGLKWIDLLYSFIRNENVIKLKYKPFIEEKASVYKIHPYLLKEYNNRWFLLAWNEDENLIFNFALDRIKQVKKVKGKYNAAMRALIMHYFDHIIGVSVPRKHKIETIKLKVDAKFYPYLETKPLHHSQRLVESGEKEKIITLELIINTELELMLMKYFDRMEVISPNHLRKNILKMIKHGLNEWNKQS
jgi:predicted DNA-binding transcriptional regulator YafY